MADNTNAASQSLNKLGYKNEHYRPRREFFLQTHEAAPQF